jgi:DNA-3-methyladenine glycosylase
MTKLKREYFIDNDTLWLARDLLGKVLYSSIDNEQITAGIITETEAYLAPDDKASHAYGNKKTKRTQTMFLKGGVAYIYLCYGIHHLFNIVTNEQNIAHAILVRSVMPVLGFPQIQTRMRKQVPFLLNGPGKLTNGLGIKTSHNAENLSGSVIWLEEHGIRIPRDKITIGPRIGVDYAGEDARLPYRYYIEDRPFLKSLKENINPVLL